MIFRHIDSTTDTSLVSWSLRFPTWPHDYSYCAQICRGNYISSGLSSVCCYPRRNFSIDFRRYMAFQFRLVFGVLLLSAPVLISFLIFLRSAYALSQTTVRPGSPRFSFAEDADVCSEHLQYREIRGFGNLQVLPESVFRRSSFIVQIMISTTFVSTL